MAGCLKNKRRYTLRIVNSFSRRFNGDLRWLIQKMYVVKLVRLFRPGAAIALVAALCLMLVAPDGGNLGSSTAHAQHAHGPEVVRDGSSPDAAAGSCWDIKQHFPDRPDGIYWLLTPHMDAPQEFYCDQTTNGGGWVMVGKGREGWERFPEGHGDQTRLLNRDRTPAEFSPVQLPAATIDGLLAGTGVNELDEGIRVVRAKNSSGTSWQTVDFRPNRMDTWSWAIPSYDTVAGMRIDNGAWRWAGSEIYGGIGPNVYWFNPSAGWNVLDTSISRNRSYHMGFGYHNNLRAGSTSGTDFIWSRSCTAPIPYAELYLRPKVSSVDGFEPIDDTGTPGTHGSGVVSNFASPTTWGVTGNLTGRTAEGNAPVQAFTQIGDTVYVGGNFTHAEQRSTGRKEPRTSLAAFDATTGDLREEFSVQLDSQVKALLTLPDGRLLVGGEFTHVNGERRVGTVALDPVTGAVDPSWTLKISNALTSGAVSVRSLALGGDHVYLGGNFTHLAGSNVGESYSRAAGRVSLDGNPDRSWNPEFNGTIVDIDVSEDASRFYAGGYFTRVDGAPTIKAAALTTNPGAAPAADWQFEGSYRREEELFQQAVDATEGLVFFGGSQHSVFGYEPETMNRVSGTITTRDGGDFQAIDSKDGITYAGCHCSDNMYENAYTWPTLNADFTGVDHIRWVGAFDSHTGEQLGEFAPHHLKSDNAGAWSLFVADDGALWVGGDFTASHTDMTTSQWNGGWVRYPAQDNEPPAAPAEVTVSPGDDASGTVVLQWAGDPDAVAYEILRDDRPIASVEAPSTGSIIETTVAQGGNNRFFVRAVDAAGNRSASSPVAVPPTADGGFVPATLIAPGAHWRYLYNEGTPADDWATPHFDHSTWQEGPVPIGYGSDDVVTTLTPPATPADRPITTWFAHEITVDDPSLFSVAALEYVADDGAVVYVNGREVDRTRMADGSVHPLTRAHEAISTRAAHRNPSTVEIPSHLFVEGRNVIAVETHLNYLSSPNMSFDASLVVTDFSPAPTQPDVVPALEIPEGSMWRYWFETDAPPVDWDTDADVSEWSEGPTPIGWGNNEVVSIIDVPARDRPRVAYFVHDLDIQPEQLIDGAYLEVVVRADDGALLRINGEEAGRKRLHEGEIDHYTNADISVNPAAAKADPLVVRIPLSDLQPGTNRIAVQSHLNYRSVPSATFELSAEVITP